jgi:gluconate 5-dehydrogenase
MNDFFSLKDKVVLITGGNGHLGKAMCEVLCQYEATLIIASRNIKKNNALRRYLIKKFNANVIYIEMDLSVKTSVLEGIQTILSKFNKIDVLINNSYYGAGNELLSMTDQEWEQGINGSINSCFRITQLVLNHMMKKGSGKIINISSIYGIVAPNVSIYENNNFYNPANYGVGKAGIIHLTKYIAAVYGKYGITCNCISPGPFPNNNVQKNFDFIKKLEKQVPLNRIGIPNDLKGIVLLLASDNSNYINGANIPVDGGWTIW